MMVWRRSELEACPVRLSGAARPVRLSRRAIRPITMADRRMMLSQDRDDRMEEDEERWLT